MTLKKYFIWRDVPAYLVTKTKAFKDFHLTIDDTWKPAAQIEPVGHGGLYYLYDISHITGADNGAQKHNRGVYSGFKMIAGDIVAKTRGKGCNVSYQVQRKDGKKLICRGLSGVINSQNVYKGKEIILPCYYEYVYLRHQEINNS